MPLAPPKKFREATHELFLVLSTAEAALTAAVVDPPSLIKLELKMETALV